MATTATKPRSMARARRAERTRDEILRAGLRVFSRKGFSATTMDDIALELEATRGLLYYHFDTKEEILGAILGKSDLVPKADLIVAGLKSLKLEQALEMISSGALAVMQSNQELVRFLHVQALLSTAEAQLVYSKVLSGFYDSLTEVLEHFKQVGEIGPEVSARDAAQIIVHQLMTYFIMDKMFGPGQAHGPGYLRQLNRILMNGLALKH